MAQSAGRNSVVVAQIIPMIAGVFFVATGVVGGTRSRVLLGSALVAAGLLNIVVPLRLRPDPALSPAQARARSAAATALPDGCIYLLAGVLLLTPLVPTTERTGATSAFAAVAIAAGALVFLSGIGALLRAARPDPTETPPTHTKGA